MQTRRPARRRKRRAVCVVLVLAIVVGIVSLAAHLRMTAALSAGQRQKLVHYAESFEGEPYESTAFTCPGIGPGLCAGYVRRVYLDTLGKERGDIGRTTAEQMQELSARSANGNGVYLTASSIRYDKSGLLQTKAMGMQLGDRGINIATMDVALRADGSTALAILTLDSELPSGLIDQVGEAIHAEKTVEVDLEETVR